MRIAPSNRLLTLGLVLCVAGLGAGIGIARLSGGSSGLGLAEVAEAVQSGSAARATVRPAELVAAPALPSLGAAPKRGSGRDTARGRAAAGRRAAARGRRAAPASAPAAGDRVGHAAALKVE
jgi:hypothetical protein